MVAFRSTDKTSDDPLTDFALLSPVILDRFFTKNEFIQLTERYPHLRIERERDGKIFVMSPVKTGSVH